MSWDQRQYRDPPTSGWGRFAAWWSRNMGSNPLDWSVPLYTLFGINVRIHLIFIIMIASELLTAGKGVGLANAAAGIAALFILVLLHEYGHCFACRWVGGSADRILMWPLGGLASCNPPHQWRADLITTLGGPAVNLALFPVFGSILLALGQGWSAFFINPISPWATIGTLSLSDGTQPQWLLFIGWLHYANLMLLLFNMLIPMYPMDAGRTLHALLWRSIGHDRATWIVVNVGLAVAIALFIYAITTNQSRLMGLALFGGLTCFMERKRLELERQGFTIPTYSGPAEDPVRTQVSRAEQSRQRQAERLAKQREKDRQQAEADQAELDRILAKIAKDGMGALTSREKSWLQRETEKRRDQ